MTTLRPSPAILLLAALAAAPAPARAGDLRHLLNIYLDDKEEPLRLPEGVACSEKGALIVADTGNGRLLSYTYRDGKLEGGAPIRLAEATHPTRVELDGRGNLLVLDRRQRRIVRVDTAGKFGGAVELKGVVGASRIGVSAFKLDAAGNVYVLDVVGRRALVALPDGSLTRELPWPAAVEFTDLAVEGERILAVDAVASRLWAVEKDATAFKPVGEGLKDRLAFPIYLSQERGMLRAVDQNGHGIAILSSDGTYRGRELEMGWTDGKVYYPAQICSNGAGQLFVADRNNNRVQVFSESR